MRIACIGSRKLHQAALDVCRELGKYVAEYGICVSGAAPGADQAFMSGAFMAGGHVEGHLPWITFEHEFQEKLQGPRVKWYPKPEPRELGRAAAYFEKFRGFALTQCSPGIQKLMARNVGIVENADAVIAFPQSFGDSGGTQFGMYIGRRIPIPVLDLSNPEHLSVIDFLNRLRAA